jgi:hypothetical protein
MLWGFLTVLCTQWSEPKIAGVLDHKIIAEASGLAISRQYSDRMYHNNDSGDGAFFYLTRMDGSETQKVTVPKMKPRDVEDLSLGPCRSGTCIYLADIGDNDEKRKSIEIWILQEEEKFGNYAKVERTLFLTYPDRAHNAEAMAVDPVSGDIYILTKEEHKEVAYPAQLFRVRSSNLKANRGELELVGEVDIPFLNSDLEVWGQIATGMDISPDGSKLILLTYQNAIEIDFGLLNRSIDSRQWAEGIDFSRAALTYIQQEAIAYANDGKSFYYDSEFNADESDQSYIYQVSCID